MSAGAAAAMGGAAAAAQAEEEMRQEEEEMTKYDTEDLAGDWEFKIVRSNTAAFRKPHVLRQVCEEEHRTGWVLVEKFDNSRLRFKRPATARTADAPAGIDPYRTQYGIPTVVFVILIIAGPLLGLALLTWCLLGF